MDRAAWLAARYCARVEHARRRGYVVGGGGTCLRCRRNSASIAVRLRLPYTLTMLGFGTGRHPDGSPDRSFRRRSAFGRRDGRAGQPATSWLAMAPSLWVYALAQGVLIGFLGSSATFGPLLADVSHWFESPARAGGGDLRLWQLSGWALSGRRSCSISSKRLAGAATHVGIGHLLLGDHVAVDRLRCAGARRSAIRTCCRYACVLFRRPSTGLGLTPRVVADFADRSPGCPAVSRCRCRRYTSSLTVAISVMAWLPAHACCR
jgi:hypothetical protein